MHNQKDCIYFDICTNECAPNCIRYLQMNRLLELSNLPDKLRKPIKIYATNDNAAYQQLDDIKTHVVDFVEGGKNLYICSRFTGNAKTTWAVKIMLKYFDKKWPKSYDVTRGLFVHVPTLLLDIKKFNEIPEYVSRIKDADLVVWDDIAISKLTEFEHEQLLQFIDSRITNGKSNIYTSNITDQSDLIAFIGGRLSSRIYSQSKVIEFFAGDFRVDGGND